MSSYEYDPITGVRKQQLAPGNPLQTMFGGGGGPTSTGGTGYGASPFGTGATAPNPQSYRDLILNDPFYRQTLADLSAQGIADEAGARAAAQRGFIRFGEVPTEELDASLTGWIDPTTRTLAEQNTAAGLSQKARLDKLNKDNIRAIRNVLAARGALRSGEFGYQLGEEQQRYTTGQYDARQSLLDYLGQIQAGLAAGRRAAQMAAAQALQGAAGRAPMYGAPPPAAPPAAPPPTPPPAQPTVTEQAPRSPVNPFEEPERLVYRPPHWAY